MKSFKIKIHIIVLLSCFQFILFGCKKIHSQKITTNTTFNHVYPLKKHQKCHTLAQTEDKGFLIIGSQDGSQPFDENTIIIIKTDAHGNTLSTKYIEGDSFFIPFISTQKDGSTLICPNYYGHFLYKLDKNGEIIFKKPFSFSNFYADYGSFPLQKDNGEIVFASSTETTNFGDFYLFNNNGDFNKTLPIIKGNIIPRSAYNCVYKAVDTANYCYYGFEYVFGQQIFRIFVSKQVNSVWIKSTVVDFDNKQNNNFPDGVQLKHIIMPNGNLMLYNQQLDASNNKYKGYIAVIDDNLNVVWDMALEIGSNGTKPFNIALCPDGNFLVSGGCYSNSNLLMQPFACKINSYGKIIWSKIFTTTLSGAFNSGMQLTDGSFVFGGTTNSFGIGENLNDIFLVKTDAAGNLN